MSLARTSHRDCKRRKRRRSRQTRRNAPARRGVVLIIVLVVIVILALSTYAFTRTMLSNYQATLLNGRNSAARQLVASGADSVRLFLLNDEATRTDMGGIFNNPAMFQAVPVVVSDVGYDRGNFSVLAPAVDENGDLTGLRYGLEDASNRLNVNALLVAEEALEGSGRDLLMGLPGMTEEVADAILDWIDEDDEPREFGVEYDYYATLDPPYAPRNGPLQSVEELLKVAGVTPMMLFGMDTNRNGMEDPHELNDPLLNGTASAGGTAGGTTDTTATTLGATADATTADTMGLDRGWAGYLTIHSKENNVNKLGDPRVFVNNPDLEELSDELSEVFDQEWVTFILAYRLYGPSDSNNDGEAAEGRTLDLSQEPKNEITTILDLLDTKVEVTFSGERDKTVLKSPFPADIGAMALYLPILLDGVTATDQPAIPGRININECSLTLLLGIPGMTEEIAQQILQERPLLEEAETADERFDSEAWILMGGIVTLEEMRTLMPFVNAGGDVFQAQVVGYFEDGGASSRAEVVIDATSDVPSIVFWRDISHLGRGYTIDVLGAQMVDTLPQN